MNTVEKGSAGKFSPTATNQDTERGPGIQFKTLSKNQGSNSTLNLGMVDPDSDLKQRYNIRVLKPNHLMTHVNPITQEPIKMHSIPSISSQTAFQNPYEALQMSTKSKVLQVTLNGDTKKEIQNLYPEIRRLRQLNEIDIVRQNQNDQFNSFENDIYNLK